MHFVLHIIIVPFFTGWGIGDFSCKFLQWVGVLDS